MPKLKLTYFDFHGGRGEPPRLALSIGGIPFDGRALAQSNAINHCGCRPDNRAAFASANEREVPAETARQPRDAHGCRHQAGPADLR